MENKQLFSRHHSHYIQGIAIILMFIHHLFAFPDRMSQKYSIIPLFDSFPLEQTIGAFGKYCVPLFLFMSGYGFAITNRNDNKYYLRKIGNFYKNYWIVFFIFIPIDYFIFHTPQINLEFKLLFQNMIGYSSTYNGEWWFIILYLSCIMITPILQKNRNLILSIIIISFITKNINTNNGETNSVLNWILAYIIGFAIGVYSKQIYYFVENRIRIASHRIASHRIASHRIASQIILKLILSITFIFITFYCMMYWSYMSMLYLVPLLAISIRFISDLSGSVIRRLIEAIGKNCMFMWLTHSFYCYHFAKDFIYSPRYTILILINLLLISYITSIVLNKISCYLSVSKNK